MSKVQFSFPHNDEMSDAPRARVVEWLRNAIDRGDWKPGHVLPAAGKISETLGVNRRTVYAALDLLDQEGLIRSNGGRLRIVNGRSKAVSRVMSHAFVVFTHFPESVAEMPGRDANSLSEITQSVYETALASQRHLVVLDSTWVEEWGIESLLENDRPAGVIFADFVDENHRFIKAAQMLRDHGVPVSIFGNEKDISEFDCVLTDHARGASELTQFLYKRGARRIVNVWTNLTQASWIEDRERGYHETMKSLGLTPEPVLFWPVIAPVWQFEATTFEREVRNLMGYIYEYLKGPQPVHAIMALTDIDFFLIAAACRNLGREPGRDVLITGYDNMWQNSPARAFESSVPVATIDKKNTRIGQLLVQLLAQRIRGELLAEPQKRIVEPECVTPETHR